MNLYYTTLEAEARRQDFEREIRQRQLAREAQASNNQPRLSLVERLNLRIAMPRPAKKVKSNPASA